VAAEPLAAVARAVGLREGPRGVEEVLRHLAGPAPAIRRLSRRTSIPVPVMAAICNELRAAGLLAPGRPVRLSAAGRELVVQLGGGIGADPACPACAGIGVAPAGEPADAASRLAWLLEGAPPADPTLDQVHCTVATKLRRIAYLRQSGALDGRSVLLLGDDDFLALAIALEAGTPGRRAPARLTVLDADPAILAFTQTALRRTALAAELVLHDLRRPLPRRLVGAFDTVFTDPPYTHRGAELFLSRGREALRPEGGHAFLCFGPQAPADGARLQHAVTGLGFAIHRLARNFNEYLGAGVLAGTSHLYHLVTAGAGDEAAPEAGGLYTWERAGALRTYSCRGCGAHLTVGPGRRPATVLALREGGCPHCRGRAFQPGPRVSRSIS
jgi:predicted methyltransferase